MGIVAVEVFLLDFPLARRRMFSTGGNDSRGAVLIRIEDEDGTAGWGETYPTAAGVEKLAAIGGLLLGRDPDAAAANHALLWAASGEDGFATSAASIALDDLRTRRRGLSVSALYGGRRRERVRPYASSEGYVAGERPAETWLAEADRVVEGGFAGFKLRIGREDEPEEMAAAAAVRAAHPALMLMADGNAAYSMRQAVRVGAHLHDQGFTWFEEPLPTAGYAGYERLRTSLPLALAGGESVQGPREGVGLVDRGAFDIIQPDVSICGGIGDAVAIAAAARLAAIETQPHACNGAINMAATLQLLAVLPDPTRLTTDAPMLEHDFGPNLARTDLLLAPLAVRDGWLDIPAGPGLGVEVDEEFVRATAVSTTIAGGRRASRVATTSAEIAKL